MVHEQGVNTRRVGGRPRHPGVQPHPITEIPYLIRIHGIPACLDGKLLQLLDRTIERIQAVAGPYIRRHSAVRYVAHLDAYARMRTQQVQHLLESTPARHNIRCHDVDVVHMTQRHVIAITGHLIIVPAPLHLYIYGHRAVPLLREPPEQLRRNKQLVLRIQLLFHPASHDANGFQVSRVVQLHRRRKRPLQRQRTHIANKDAMRCFRHRTLQHLF